MDFTKDNDKTLYSGKWTEEEESYVKALMSEFRAGTLDIPEGTSLRFFLAHMLGCKPKRISKKYENSGYNGKRLYSPQGDGGPIGPDEVKARRSRLEYLQSEFKQSRKAVEAAKVAKKATSVSSASIADPQGSGRMNEIQDLREAKGASQGSNNLNRATGAHQRGPGLAQHHLSYAAQTDLSRELLNRAMGPTTHQGISLAPHLRKPSILTAAMQTPSRDPILMDNPTARFGAAHLNTLVAAHSLPITHRDQLISALISVMRAPPVDPLQELIREENRKRAMIYGNAGSNYSKKARRAF